MNPTAQETRVIRQELRRVGVTSFGLAKFVSHSLPSVLHEGEHIQGAVYGRYGEGTGLLRWIEGMLIATDRRIIFLDHKPGFEAMDELTYDVVSGVQKSYAWPFASVTLHTRVSNYTLRFANKKCIDTFMHYIEGRRLESPHGAGDKPLIDGGAPSSVDDKALAFLNDHDVAVFSTIDRAGNVHGAAVHYLVVDNHALCILTKAETQKAHNVFAHHQVALTVYDPATMQTLQLQGTAALETDALARNRVFAALSKPRVYGEHVEYPPVTSLTNGAYTVIRITPFSVRLSNFSRHVRV